MAAAIPQLILKAFLSRDLMELRALRDELLDKVISGQGGYLSASTVNGSSFTFAAGMSCTDVLQFVQQAIDYKERGVCRPITRSNVYFV
jgi:hypothetical protein